MAPRKTAGTRNARLLNLFQEAPLDLTVAADWQRPPVSAPIKGLPRAQGRRKAGSILSCCLRGYSLVLGALGLPDQVVRIVSIQLPGRLGALDQLSCIAEHC
jgi:hypothetical protein